MLNNLILLRQHHSLQTSNETLTCLIIKSYRYWQKQQNFESRHWKEFMKISWRCKLSQQVIKTRKKNAPLLKKKE